MSKHQEYPLQPHSDFTLRLDRLCIPRSNLLSDCGHPMQCHDVMWSEQGQSDNLAWVRSLIKAVMANPAGARADLSLPCLRG